MRLPVIIHGGMGIAVSPRRLARGVLTEPPLVTSGNEVTELARLVRPDEEPFAAGDVLRYLRAPVTPGADAPAGLDRA